MDTHAAHPALKRAQAAAQRVLAASCWHQLDAAFEELLAILAPLGALPCGLAPAADPHSKDGPGATETTVRQAWEAVRAGEYEAGRDPAEALVLMAIPRR